ncbi:DUF1521 domain-containing protein [Corallococcus praedator]|uniref:DUF1521 domain-containing protein n=1 Tax=Corallococcus praedator TaxID=2316724 RepID=A0ABX9Q8S0_9BACT|nr:MULTISPECIES: DUF1521 domain-containing protein [Corallococcus]RKH19337.1 DUF1521 domain-containing protein [Corallococcus sp. CA031C]RKH92612.1 DUF1521 domain-containing protein [Corallococcus praedator]
MATNISGLNTQALSVKNPAQGVVNDATIAKNTKLIETTLGQVDKAIAGATAKSDKANAKADQMGKSVTTKSASASSGAFPTELPNPLDNANARYSLEVKDNKITTPGGYVIEPLGQFEWKVTGPDGKETRVWGDPHVDEGDGGKWDFKNDTTFVLGDGTRINVNTVPYGNGMTVTGSLDIIMGDDHVSVKDLDKGKGTISAVKRDAVDEAVRFAGQNKTVDVVTMGTSTDDWTFESGEIVGSENGGEILKKGNEINVSHTYGGSANPALAQSNKDPLAALQNRLNAVTNTFDSLAQTKSAGFNPFNRVDDFGGSYDKSKHRKGMTEAFDSVTNMLKALKQIPRMSDTVRPRNIIF